MSTFRVVHRFVTFGLLLAVAGLAAALAQDTESARVEVTDLDRAAAREGVVVSRHAFATHFTAGERGGHATLLDLRHATAGAAEPSRHNVRFPGDLIFQGGPTVGSAESHAIYMLPNGKCPVATCWGNPEGFLRDLGQSNFIHVVDQYTGSYGNNRYTVGSHRSLSYKPPAAPFTDADMEAVVHAVASKLGLTGYGHIYHVFLPPGQDECFTSTDGVCYSPDNSSTFVFCAYHSSVDFPDIGHVLYSVEPFQDVNGCSVRPGTPNGQLVDSTNDVLSHETIETITYPDGSAWWNSVSLSLYGEEIGDECIFLVFTPTSVYSDPSLYYANGKLYATQPEYDNSVHGCSTGPRE